MSTSRNFQEKEGCPISQQTQRRSLSLRTNSPPLLTTHQFSSLPIELYRSQPVESESYSCPESRTLAVSDRVDILAKKKLHLAKQLAETKGVTLMEGEEQELESDIKEGIWQVVEEKQRKILTEIEDQEKRDSLNREKELRNRDEADLEEGLRRSREERLWKANLGTDIDYPYGRPSESRIPTSSVEPKLPYHTFDQNPLAQKSF